MESLEIDDVGDEWRLVVKLSVPVRYLRHSPATRGSQVLVELEPLRLGAGEPPPLLSRETLRPARSGAESPVIEVAAARRGETSLGLDIRFARSVAYSVELGADSRSVVIRIPRKARQLPAPTNTEVDRTQVLLVEARHAITANELDRATTLLRKALVTSDGDEADTQTVMELLGVTLERRGQLAHARAEYEEYLSRWPTGDGADRVRQRLDALLTARAPIREPLQEPVGREERSETEAELYGSMSASYARAEAIDGVAAGTVYDSSMFTDVALIGRVRDPRFELRSELIASYRFDLVESSSGDDTRISRLFVDVGTPDRRTAATLGRQSRSNGGVLGRFDGLRLEKTIGDPDFANRISVSALGGFLVDGPSTTSVSTDRLVYSTAIDFERILGNADAQVFFTGQQNHGLVDRMAVGGELRWFERGRFGLAFVDYDVYFQSLNTALLTGNFAVFDRVTVNLLAETRNSPILTLQNSLSGQLVADNIDELTDAFSNSELRDLAKDRTARSWTASLGATHRTSDRVQLAGDVAVTSTGSTPESGGVPALTAFGPEVGIGLQASISELLMRGDYSNISLRYRLGEFADTMSWNASLRLPATSGLRTTVRFSGDYRDGSSGNRSTERLSLRPSLRLDWRALSLAERFDFLVDAEFGLDWSDDFAAEFPADDLSYFGEVVLRVDF